MIRRAHQIAVSLFLEETGELGITNRQYGIMLVLKAQPGIDQITVAKLLGLDRSTTGMVLSKLEDAGLVGRVVGANDRQEAEPQADAGRRADAGAARGAGPAGAGARAVGVLAARAEVVPRSAGKVRPRLQRHDARAARWRRATLPTEPSSLRSRNREALRLGMHAFPGRCIRERECVATGRGHE